MGNGWLVNWIDTARGQDGCRRNIVADAALHRKAHKKQYRRAYHKADWLDLGVATSQVHIQRPHHNPVPVAVEKAIDKRAAAERH